MPNRIAQGIAGLTLIVLTAGLAAHPLLADAGFLGESHKAMDRMMVGMAAAPSGNVDHDFAVMMIPHHQGAIDMAVAELRYGHDERLRRIAQEIVVDQQQEIVVMRSSLEDHGDAAAGRSTATDMGADMR